MMRLKHSCCVLLLTASATVSILGGGCGTSSQAQSAQWSPQEEREQQNAYRCGGTPARTSATRPRDADNRARQRGVGGH